MEDYLKYTTQHYPNIECILFDLDNTLIETRKADSRACEKIANELKEKYSICYEEASRISTHFLINFRKCPDNPRKALDKWRTYLWSQALGEKYQQDAELIYKKWLMQRYQNLALPKEMILLLESLRKRFRIGLITNGPSAAQWEKIEKLNLRSYFDIILVSGDLSYEKPDKNIFWQACDYLNVNPKHCLMVGDKLETDILGGLNAKLGGTVWLPLGSRYDLVDTDPQPDYVIKNVMDLKCFLLSPYECNKKLTSLRLAQGKKATNMKKLRMSPLYIDFNAEGDHESYPSTSDGTSRVKYTQLNKVFSMDEDSNSNASDGS